jgi:hypothetical protein
LDAAGASDRRVSAECLVDGEETAIVHGRDQMVILRLQPHDVSLQIGYAAIQVANLLEQARVTASKVP